MVSLSARGSAYKITMLGLAEAMLAEEAGWCSSVVHRLLTQDDPSRRQPLLVHARRAPERDPKGPLRAGFARPAAPFEATLSGHVA